MIQRNLSARKNYNLVVEENGLRNNWISNKLEISNSTLSHWKLGNFDLGEEKLTKVEKFLQKYK